MTRATLDSVLHYARALAGSAAAAPEADLLKRFLACREEAAFAGLVERHGAMVLGVCRRVLGNAADAEDAFQATFLVLARQAAALRKRASLAAWLYGIACRVAWRARADAARRRLHERQAQPPRPDVPCPEPTAEIGEVLAEELARLPEKYRAPVVLCYVEGRTNEEAARQLGWPVGSVKGRLARARDLLRARLTRRGLAPSAALLTAALAALSVEAVPASLAQVTVRSALATGLGLAADGVPASVSALAAAALRPAALTKSKLALAAVALLAAVGLMAASVPQGAEPPAPARGRERGPDTVAQKPAAPGPAKPVAVERGRDPLPAGARARLGNNRFRHGGEVHSLDYSPDGKVLVTSGWQQAVCLWDVATGRSLRRLAGHRRHCNTAVFSPDGKVIASCGEDLTVRLWDAVTGNPIHVLAVGASEPTSVAFSPDGKLLAASTWNGTLLLWDVATGNAAGPLPRLPRTACPVVFSPDGKTLAVGSHDSSVHVLELATGKELRCLHAGGGGGVSVAYSRDGQLLAIGNLAGNVRLHDAATGKLLRSWSDSGYVQGLAFSPDGKLLASGHYVSGVTPRSPANVRLWDTVSGQEGPRLENCTGSIHTVKFSPDGRTLAAADGTTVRRWDLATGRELMAQSGHRGAVLSVALSPDGRTVFSAGLDGSLRRWDAPTGKEVGTVVRHESAIVCVRLSPDGKVLGWTGGDSMAYVWKLDGAKRPRQLAGHGNGLRALAFSANGQVVATAGGALGLRLWEEPGKEPRRFGAGALIFNLAFSPDGKTLATGGYDGKSGRQQFKLWDAVAGKEVSCVAGLQQIHGVAFSPDGRRVATALAGDKAAVRIYDTRGPGDRSLVGPRGGACDVTFTPDGHMLASAGYDGMVRLWELVTGQERRRLEGHDGPVHCLALAGDGRTLVSGGADGTLIVWDVAASARREAVATAAELEQCWADLAGPDAARAYDAICRLAACPKQSVPLLRERLLNARPEAEQVKQWIRALDDARFAVREKATGELARLGRQIEPELRRALAGASPEARLRLGRLLADLGANTASLRPLRAQEVLERAGTPEALLVLRRLKEQAANEP